jgi:hypothetical protein
VKNSPAHSIVAIEHLGGNIPYIVSGIVPAQMDRARLLQEGRLRAVNTADDNQDEAALLSREELPLYAATETDRMRCHAWLRMHGASFFLVHFTQGATEQTHDDGWPNSFGKVIGEEPDTKEGAAPPSASSESAPMDHEFRPRVIPSKESWIAAREEISELEQEIGRQRREELEKPGNADPIVEQPKAWRNYHGEDGWDENW